MLEAQVVGKDFRGRQAAELALAKNAEELLDAGVLLRILLDELFDALGGVDVFKAQLFGVVIGGERVAAQVEDLIVAQCALQRVMIEIAQMDHFPVLCQVEGIGSGFPGNGEGGEGHDLCPLGEVIGKLSLMFLMDPSANVDHIISVVRFRLVPVTLDRGG